jgi:hypothetical protein
MILTGENHSKMMQQAGRYQAGGKNASDLQGGEVETRTRGW